MNNKYGVRVKIGKNPLKKFEFNSNKERSFFTDNIKDISLVKKTYLYNIIYPNK